MTNWEYYFGTPERASLMCMFYYSEPPVIAVNRFKLVKDTLVPMLVTWFSSHEEYVAWLKAEHDDGTVEREEK